MTKEQKERLKKRFFAMVNATPTLNGCREWLGHVAPNGYGTFQLCEGGESVSELAHRVAFAIGTDDFSILRLYGGDGGKHGPVIRHSRDCEFKRCVEFMHLTHGTQRENIEDNAATGKLLRGEAVGTSKMTEVQVQQILTDYAAWPKSEKTGKPKRGVLERLAEKHGVTRQMIWQIVHGKWWKRVGVPIDLE